MAIKQADILSNKRLKKLLDQVMETNPNPEIMRVAFMLSYYAGLRVQEIAGLDWRKNVMDSEGNFKEYDFPVYDVNGDKVLDADGNVVSKVVEALYIGKDIGKYGRVRSIPLNPILRDALRELFDFLRGDLAFPPQPHVIPSAQSNASQGLSRRAHALKMRIIRVYKALGLEGCSSHSGRRTFITRAAAKANTVGQTLRDVQILAGHQNLATTQGYIVTSDQHHKLVGALFE